MEKLRGLLGMRRMDRFLNLPIRELCGVKKGVDERWFGHVERMENNRTMKRTYVVESAGSLSVSRPWKRWIDTMKDCLRTSKENSAG